jgi:hypothetical protein
MDDRRESHVTRWHNDSARVTYSTVLTTVGTVRDNPISTSARLDFNRFLFETTDVPQLFGTVYRRLSLMT